MWPGAGQTEQEGRSSVVNSGSHGDPRREGHGLEEGVWGDGDKLMD